MSTPTPKRKRGQHVNKHPWSNLAVDLVNPAWDRWSNSKAGIEVWRIDGETRRMFLAFVAGYRAGKAAI